MSEREQVGPTPSASGHGGSATARRALFVGVGAALATAAVQGVDAVTAEASAAPKKKLTAAQRAKRRRKLHAKKCRHFHRCAKHRAHTCRRKHACKHRNHKAPKKPVTPPKPPTPTPPSPVAPVAPVPALLMVRRFTYGHSSQPGTTPLATQMASASHGTHRGARAWFEQQLAPTTVADPVGDEIDTWWPSLTLPPAQIGVRNNDETESGWVVEANMQRWALARRIHSTRQVHEVMSEFWENHLHVAVHADGVFPFRPDYSRTVRKHALGTFADLLHACVTHPAMGVYLSNGSSTKRAPNENLGRELLELHTVGTGQFTEDDVKNSARILTGWRADSWTPWSHRYDPASHFTGPVRVMGFSHANTDPDGRAVTRAYTTYLATHPATARRIARRLAIRFVTEHPTADFVERIAQNYLRNGTDIKAVLRFVVESPEFRGATASTLVRTPTDDVVATVRALGIRVARPTGDDASANQLLWIAHALGQTPFAWPRPDGQPVRGAAWASASRLLGSFRFHWNAAFGWYPRADATVRHISSWADGLGPTFTLEAFCTHVATAVLGHAPAAHVVAAGATAMGLDPSTVITRDGEKLTVRGRGDMAWELPGYLATVLDSPAHLHR